MSLTANTIEKGEKWGRVAGGAGHAERRSGVLTGREREVLVHGLAALPQHLPVVGGAQQLNQARVAVILVG